MSTRIEKGRATKHTDKGDVTQTPQLTTINSKTRSQQMYNVPCIVGGQEYTLDVGSMQIIADTYGISFKEQVQIVRSNDTSGDAARGKNAANAAIAAMLVKNQDIDLIEIPHENYAELATKTTPPHTSGKQLEVKPLISFEAVTQFISEITAYAAEKVSNLFVFQKQKQIMISTEAIKKHNDKIKEILIDIFDEKLVNARWGKQLASTTTMWGIKRNEGCSLTRSEIIQNFVDTDEARYAYACMC